jgi:hypothetical protein
MLSEYPGFKQGRGFVHLKAELLLPLKRVRSAKGSDVLRTSGIGHHLSAAGFKPHLAALFLPLCLLENRYEGTGLGGAETRQVGATHGEFHHGDQVGFLVAGVKGQFCYFFEFLLSVGYHRVYVYSTRIAWQVFMSQSPTTHFFHYSSRSHQLKLRSIKYAAR